MSDEEQGCWSKASAWRGHPLLSARLRLRPLKAGDAPRLAELLDDWDVVRYTAAIPHPYTVEDAVSFVATTQARSHDGKGVALAMERTLDGAVIGIVGFGLETDGTPELGWWVGRAYWGQGYATEAARRLLRHLFADLGYASAWAAVHPDNAASRAVMGKLGMYLAKHQLIGQPARGESVVMPVYRIDTADWARAHAERPTLLVAAAALIDVDGRVLMASRPAGKMMSGLWEFPGGKVHAGETPEAALVRELAEELGIDVGESCLAPLAFASHDYDTFHLLMPLYAVRQWKGTVTPLEGQGLKWVRAERLGDLPMPPADIPLVALLRDWL
ncbi:MAG TPA: bifunctional GNAT family N-acetyltransferase/(deoxy)nucleoside triphosphate pyrophosphohydrolase [Magnetospirillum sp.]|jgi:8-oxo-dGTP diphosphatase|nr:bifunctional GNAT family N-acetyltransferase/(deoxy)nucleoside triphosphate pyrophosphohydrolase [Magnetospirillum sp.]